MHLELLILSELDPILSKTGLFSFLQRLHHHYCTILVPDMVNLKDPSIVLELSL